MDIFSVEWWPSGPWGAFWLFLLPIGPGTSAGILVGKNGGVGAIGIAAIYLASDIVTALYLEPCLRLARRYGGRYAWSQKLGQQFSQVAARTQLGAGRWGQFAGLTLLSLGGGMATGAMGMPGASIGRPLGWTGVILGDMIYFVLILATALGLASVLPDDRLVFVGILLVAMLAGPIVRRASGMLNGPTARESASAPARR